MVITEDDIIAGLRERNLPVDSLDDLTAKERSLLHQHTDMALNEATREVLQRLGRHDSLQFGRGSCAGSGRRHRPYDTA